jgi:hypothetical protein
MVQIAYQQNSYCKQILSYIFFWSGCGLSWLAETERLTRVLLGARLFCTKVNAP